MSRPALSVVVPVYNAEPYLVEMFERCFLDGLRHAPRDAELVLVDDASPLEAQTRRAAGLAERLMPVKYVRNPRNAGFVRSVNAGLRAAEGEALLLLNSDARLTPGAAESLLRVLRSAPDAGLAGPVSNGAFGADLQQAEGFAPLRDYSAEELARIDRFAAELRSFAPAPAEAAYLMGFCLLMRREVLESVGALDERFGLGYLEELDYCVRARAKGWRLLVDRATFVFHGGLKGQGLHERGGTQTMRLRPWRAACELARNSLYFLWKHGARAARRQRL